MTTEVTEVRELVSMAIHGAISPGDTMRLRKVLANKFADNKYDNEEERLIISALALFNDPARRARYINKVISQSRIKSLAQQ